MSNPIKDVYQVQDWDRKQAGIVCALLDNGGLAPDKEDIARSLAQFRGDAELRAIGRERSRLVRARASAKRAGKFRFPPTRA